MMRAPGMAGRRVIRAVMPMHNTSTQQHREITFMRIPAQEAHRWAGVLADMEADIFPTDSPWPASGFLHEIADPAASYFAAVILPAPGDTAQHAEVVGYAGLGMMGPQDDPEAEVRTIAVAPQWRGYGVGRALLEKLLEIADERHAPVFLEVRVDNEAAISLYQSVGFEKLGIRRNYYQPSGADAYTMCRPSAQQEQGQ